MQTTTTAGDSEQTPPASSATREVARHSAVITLTGLAGKPLALVRDILITRAFGASAATDSLFLALSLPTSIAAVVAGGGLRVAFQPELTRRLQHSPASAWRYGTALLVSVSLLTGLISAGLLFGSEFVAELLTTPEKAGELGSLIRLLAPLLLLFGLQDILTGMLHVRMRFFWPSMESVIRNASIILCVLLLASSGIRAVAYGHMLGTLLLVLACALSVYATGIRVSMPGPEERRALRSLVLSAAPATIGGAIFPLTMMLDRSMASWLEEGAVSALTYADSICQMGLVIAGPMSVVALPVLTNMAAEGKSDGFDSTVQNAVRGAAIVTVPLAALLAALAEPTVKVLFMRGQFDASHAEMTALAVSFYALGLPFLASQGVAMRALQAQGLFNHTARLAAIILVTHFVQNFVLMQLLGHRGIALGYGLSAAQLLWLVDRRLKLKSQGRLRFISRLAGSGLACYSTAVVCAGLVPTQSQALLDSLARLAAGGVGGLLAFVLVAALLWGSEGRALALRALKRR